MLQPADTGRKMNVHETFKRRLGRLLKILCTFSLSPVLRVKFVVNEFYLCIFASL